ncbi:hypothetical protein MRX96_008298 [Rhipicephalus microplus]
MYGAIKHATVKLSFVILVMTMYLAANLSEGNATKQIEKVMHRYRTRSRTENQFLGAVRAPDLIAADGLTGPLHSVSAGGGPAIPRAALRCSSARLRAAESSGGAKKEDGVRIGEEATFLTSTISGACRKQEARSIDPSSETPLRRGSRQIWKSRSLPPAKLSTAASTRPAVQDDGKRCTSIAPPPTVR